MKVKLYLRHTFFDSFGTSNGGIQGPGCISLLGAAEVRKMILFVSFMGHASNQRNQDFEHFTSIATGAAKKASRMSF